MDVLFGPFDAPFMQRALLEVLLLSVPAGVLGAWVVARRLAFMTHSIGHATFPTVVAASLAGFSTLLGALVGAIAVAVLLVFLERRRELSRGVAVAVVLSTSLALGSVMVSSAADPGVRANSLLFGSLLALTDADVWGSALIASATVIATVVLWRPLLISSFDEDVARAHGVARTRLDLAVMILLAAAVAVSIQAVGSLMVAGLFVAPAASARLATRRLRTGMVVGTAIAATCGTVGLWIAYRLNAPPGACIACLAAAGWCLVAVTGAARSARSVGMAPT